MRSSKSSIGGHGGHLGHVKSQRSTWGHHRAQLKVIGPSGTRQVTEVSLVPSERSLRGHRGHMGHVRSQRSTKGHQRAQLEVIWDTSGHRGQLGVIRELNSRSRRSSGTRQVTEVNLGSSQSSIGGHEGHLGHVRSQRLAWGHHRGHLEVTEVIWDTPGHRGQVGVITELKGRSSGTRQVTEVSLESSESSIGGHGGHLGHIRSQRSCWGHHIALLEVMGVIWDTSGHRGQLGVIRELNRMSRRSSGTGQVKKVNLGSSQSSLEVIGVSWDTSFFGIGRIFWEMPLATSKTAFLDSPVVAGMVLGYFISPNTPINGNITYYAPFSTLSLARIEAS